jgi:hypothetical protein
VSKAVLRASNALVVAGGSQNAGTALVGANLGIHAQGPIQGPALTSDPSDKTSSFIQSIDPKTGSTSKMEANVHIDEFTFSQNRNAFQRGSEKEIALAPGEVAGDTGREIKRNDYGHQRRFKPNYGEDFNAFTGEFIKEGDEVSWCHYLCYDLQSANCCLCHSVIILTDNKCSHNLTLSLIDLQ